MSKQFKHPPIGEEIQAIGGSCTIIKEDVLHIEGRELLYLVGVGVFDSSCCGTGGCAYAVVPGFIIETRPPSSPEQTAESLVEPVADPAMKARIEQAILRQENVSQVNFL